jgi:hydroxypyruvate reductase
VQRTSTQFRRASSLANTVRRAVLEAWDPADAVERAWPADLRGSVRVLAVGKAAVPMARRAATLLRRGAVPDGGVGLGPGLIVTTSGPHAPVPGFEVLVADHPLPTARNLGAATGVAAFVRAVEPEQTLLVLLSGGGSALLTAPAGGLTLDDVREATGSLLRCGATIRELNAVRKHCERLKGGKLARMVGAQGRSGQGPAPRVVVLVVSDVLGDALDVISSGPLAPDPTTYADALHVLHRCEVASAPSLARVVEHLGRGAAGEWPETPKDGDPVFRGIEHRVIASNQHAAVAARRAVLASGIGRVKVVCGVDGEAARVGEALVRDAWAFGREATGPSAVIYAGETTVTVRDAQGKGGRNQELALAAALETQRPNNPAPIAIFTLATDGVDGPTDAAGALVTSDTPAAARRARIDLADALHRHDSYRALAALGCLVKIGPTGTNVNDLAVAVVWG